MVIGKSSPCDESTWQDREDDALANFRVSDEFQDSRRGDFRILVDLRAHGCRLIGGRGSDPDVKWSATPAPALAAGVGELQLR